MRRLTAPDKRSRLPPQHRQKTRSLTFDDGPHYKYTAEILDILDEYGAKATFFVVGELAERYPELILRELAEGHEIGNHTWSHPKMKKLTVDSLKQEILKTEELLNEIADYRPKLFRPPEGAFSPSPKKQPKTSTTKSSSGPSTPATGHTHLLTKSSIMS